MVCTSESVVCIPESVVCIPGIKVQQRDADQQSTISSASSLESIEEEVIPPPKDVKPPPLPFDIQRYHKLDLSLVDDIRGQIAGYFQDKPLYYKLI